MMGTELTSSPLNSIDCSFRRYMERRTGRQRQHMKGNSIPDYAFEMDGELRKKLDAIPHFYNTAKNVTGTVASRKMQSMNRTALAVGPNQAPQIYEISCDCARRLGIGIPNIYIETDPAMNAYTYGSDDVEPFIVITSGLFERYSPEELRFIIGHECGHIHNLHTSYTVMASYLLVAGTGLGAQISAAITQLVSMGAQMALAMWSRAAEVTADRAGLICSNDIGAAYTAMAKLMYGGASNIGEIDFAAIQKQLEMQMSNIVRYEELLNNDDHPAVTRRLAAMHEFAECELLYEWTPELRKAGQICRPFSETETRCRKVIAISEKSQKR